MKTHHVSTWIHLVVALAFWTFPLRVIPASLEAQFQNPPADARPWVYWYFMDGNLTREGLTADLEAMREAGIGGAIFLEVDLGLPRGPVRFMSPEWRQLFAHAVREAERLGIAIVLGSGPGWCGTGGPWVKPEESMQHLVASETNLTGPLKFEAELQRPQPRAPFFGEGTLTPETAKQWREFYRDVAVLAFPTPTGDRRIADIDEKALYHRAPYSSSPNVKSSLPLKADYPPHPVAVPEPGKSRQGVPPAFAESIPQSAVVDLTDRMLPDGRLTWDVPAGNWTILRFVRTLTGQMTRPAPMPGLGFETDKFSRAALDSHFEQFPGLLLKEIGKRSKGPGGLTTLHFDSWEMSSQNWSERFRDEFRRHRGYDPLPFLPAYTGRMVGSEELTERFLWDVRQTAQELIIANHVTRLRDLAHKNGLSFSIEPYDMNPNSDLAMGAVADVPMCEFWWQGFDSTYSVIEAASIAHTGSRQIVAAEAFTSNPGEDWRAHPANMKSLGDWAFAAGVNRIAFHRYQHQPWLDRRPGMRMGPYGVHWERTQTWWPMVAAYHSYLARCQFLLRQGQAVADILYLAPEGAPHVFRPPMSATAGDPPDRRGYNFDGCAPELLMARAQTRNGRIVFPGGTSYAVMVLPNVETMTPGLLQKIRELIRGGAVVIGPPPRKSPSLTAYPDCDSQVRKLTGELWGDGSGSTQSRVLWNEELARSVELATDAYEPLTGAKWIWTDEGDPAKLADVGTRYFERQVELPERQHIDSATMEVTSDNLFAVWVNGRELGRGNNFHKVFKFDLKGLLVAGTNRIEIAVENEGTVPNPAGLIASLRVKRRNGSELRCETDRSWTAMQQRGGQGRAARELGPVGMAPWGAPALSGEQLISVTYPSYDVTAKLLERRSLSPDFEADGPVRYTHRRSGTTDLYFVANRSDKAVEATCVFRVKDKQPELWHPLTGQRQTLPQFVSRGERTSVPLRFEPLEAYFIVFRKPAQTPKHPAVNFSELKAVQGIPGPWQVGFDPQWGGPERVTFAALEDWTKRSEPEIRHYSGIASYETDFVWASDLRAGSAARATLNLGEVKNMARVRLNGRDLGVVWCPPWQVEITPALKTGTNHLEVQVANLWINRLIADSGLPENKRLTWTSSNPYGPNSPLSSSGLLGPVTIQMTGVQTQGEE